MRQCAGESRRKEGRFERYPRYGSQSHGTWERHETKHSQVRQRIQVTATLVLLGLTAVSTEPLEGCENDTSARAHAQTKTVRTREASDAILLAKRSPDTIRVHLRYNDLVLGVRVGIRELFVDGRKVLWTTRVSPRISESGRGQQSAPCSDRTTAQS